ncbi:MAG TPA: VOC family protein [Nitrospirota bacterium]|jgi:catechol 2,3-dioxygenase-like lactoylglutathione lyase family enzyme
MKFKGLNHLAFATGDMDMTVRYWRDLLGMRLVGSHGGPGRRQYFFELSETEFVSFFEWPGVVRAANKRHGQPVEGPFIFDHVSFGVGGMDELWALADQLVEAGFSCSNMIDHGFIRSIYTFDPNGIPLEFSCFAEGVDLVRHPVLADRDKGEAALEGAEPVAGRWPAVEEPISEDEKIIVPGEWHDIFLK